MKNFIENVLPSEGVYFLAIKVDGYEGLRHYSLGSTDEMVQKAIELDKNHTVFFACASYAKSSYLDSAGKTKYRTQENALLAKSFWLDIDCGEAKAKSGEGYPTKKDALFALGKFCSAVGLKMPTIVDSGGGIHAYFILNKPIEKVVWKETANKLKSITHALNFLVDDSRTSDIASILRPVGTHNRKAGRGVKLVELKHASDPIVWEEFKSAIDLAFAKLWPKPSDHESGSSIRAFIKDPETPLNVERMKSALSHINPNCDRALWRDICFAIHALGWSCSKELALEWSRGDYL